MANLKEKIKKIVNFETSDNKINLRSQRIITYGILILVFICLFFVSNMADQKKVKIRSSKNTNKINFSSSFNVPAEQEWLNRSEKDINDLKEENKSLNAKIRELEDKLVVNSQATEGLAIEFGNMKAHQENSQVTSKEYLSESSEQIVSNLGVVEVSLEKNNIVSEIDNDGYDLDDYLPAGSYAPALVIMGADATAGKKGARDPGTMAFKITGPAVGPEFDGRKQTIKKLYGCKLFGSVKGDLSSEKGYIRLLKMSCSFKKNKVVEFDVDAIVSSKGKEGIRGPVVSREGNLLWLSFLNKFIEGSANIASVAIAPDFQFAGGIAAQNYTISDATRQGVANGISSAAGQTGKFIQERLDEYEPVIDIQAGIEVEILFRAGVDLTKGKKPTIREEIGMIKKQNIENNNQSDDYQKMYKDLLVGPNNQQIGQKVINEQQYNNKGVF